VELVLLHIDATTAKCYTFGLQKEALFETALPWNLDCAAGTDYSLPGQTSRMVKSLRNLAGAARKSGRKCNAAIAGDFPAWNTQDCSNNPLAHAVRFRRRLAHALGLSAIHVVHRGAASAGTDISPSTSEHLTATEDLFFGSSFYKSLRMRQE
jgi:hypothetical protein